MSYSRLYRRRADGTLDFREAWHDADAGQFVVNRGTVGHQCSTESTDEVDAAAAEGLLAAFEAQCAEDGYAAADDADLWRVVAQFALKTAEGTDRDRWLERQAVQALSAHLAWRGLGTVDGSSIHDGRLNVFATCVEPRKAVAAVKTCLREATSDFTKLSIAVAPLAAPEDFKLRHAPAGVHSFTL
jgi:hypothetical protein